MGISEYHATGNTDNVSAGVDIALGRYLGAVLTIQTDVASRGSCDGTDSEILGGDRCMIR